MNVLQIVQSFCYEMGLNPVPTTLLSVTSPVTNQYIYLLYSTGRDLLQARCWIQLKRTHSITTVLGDDTYALPSDFYCSLLDTAWNTTQKWKLRGPLSDSRYNDFLYGYGIYTNQTYYRIFGRNGTDQIQLQPVPPAGEVIKFDYISHHWINNAGTWSETITSDSATTAFDDDLLILGMKWKYNQAKGNEYLSMQSEYEDKIGKAQARYKGDRKVSLSPSDYFMAIPNVPEGSFNV